MVFTAKKTTDLKQSFVEKNVLLMATCQLAKVLAKLRF